MSDLLDNFTSAVDNLSRKSVKYELQGEVIVKWSKLVTIKLHLPDAISTNEFCGEFTIMFDKLNNGKLVNITGCGLVNAQAEYVPSVNVECYCGTKKMKSKNSKGKKPDKECLCVFPGTLIVRYNTKIYDITTNIYADCLVELLFDITVNGITIHWRKHYDHFAGGSNKPVPYKTISIGSSNHSDIIIDHTFVDQDEEYGINFRILDEFKQDDKNPMTLMVSESGVATDLFPDYIITNTGVYVIQTRNIKTDVSTDTELFNANEDGTVEKVSVEEKSDEKQESRS